MTIKESLIAKNAQRYMYPLFYMTAVTTFFAAILVVEAGLWGFLFPGMLLLSPVMMAALRRLFEGPLTREFFTPRVMSWCFVVGDTVLLPSALWFAGRAWQDVVMTESEQFRTMLVALLVGILSIFGFRHLDGARYRSVGWSSALKSPTKVWHDCVVMPVTVAVFFWLLLPQIILRLNDTGRAGGTGDFVIACLFLAVFLVLVAKDGLNPPDPRKQHPKWDTKRFKPSWS